MLRYLFNPQSLELSIVNIHFRRVCPTSINASEPKITGASLALTYEQTPYLGADQ